MRSRGITRSAVVALLALSALAPTAAARADNIISGNRHWSDGSNPRAYVTINDKTPSGWPVLAATNEWATEPNLDMYYNYESCGTTGHCIDVTIGPVYDPYTGAVEECSGTPGGSGGYAVVLPLTGHIDQSLSYIRLNKRCANSFGYDSRDRRALACEELGHIIGLDHADPGLNDVTCMGSGNIRQLYEHPRTHDFTMLHSNIYDHNDP